ncbi:hypothetical protein AAC387_Pa02g1226 [Persea americana]
MIRQNYSTSPNNISNIYTLPDQKISPFSNHGLQSTGHLIQPPPLLSPASSTSITSQFDTPTSTASKASSLLSTSSEFNWSTRVGTFIFNCLNSLGNRVLICCCGCKGLLGGFALEEETVSEAAAMIDGGWQALQVSNLSVGRGHGRA